MSTISCKLTMQPIEPFNFMYARSYLLASISAGSSSFRSLSFKISGLLKIAFISSTEGGMDIEKVAKESPDKIITNKLEISDDDPEVEEIEKIISIFNFDKEQKSVAYDLVKSMYKILITKDANLIEINPLIVRKENKLICLDAKMNFDDNAIFRRPEIFQLRDLNEEEPAEIEASKYDLAYIKLNGSIGCMVNGAGLAMATMDIIKLYGEEPANFLDVGGGLLKKKLQLRLSLYLQIKM